MVSAVFFDKDGVLSKLVTRPTKKTAPWTIEELEFIDGSKAAVNLVKNHSWKTFMITNQPDFGDESAEISNLFEIMQCTLAYFRFDGFDYCIERDSDHYKPKTGMVDNIVKEHDIDLKTSIIIGDSWRDMALAYNCGMKSYYIGSKEDIQFWPEEWRNIKPDYIVTNVYAACKHIVNGGVPK
jgi:D-glycero-D-manno-heptose 1,7-bisphosphate phosphatase